jgi:hypothetical protein
MVKFSTRSSLFDGSTEYVTMGDVLGFEYDDPFSISCWVKTTDAEAYIVSKLLGSTTFRGYGIALSSGQIAFSLINDNGSTLKAQIITTATYNDDKWHHIVCTSSGSGTVAGMVVYVDGVAVAVTTASDTLGGNTILNAASFNIGSRTDGSVLLAGRLDEVSVFDAELTPAEVTLLHNSHLPLNVADFGSAPSNLVGYWRMGEGTVVPHVPDVAPRVQHPPNNDPNLTTALYLNSTIDPDSATNGYNQNASFGNVAEMNFGPTDPFTLGIWVRTNDIGTAGNWANTGSKTLFSKIAIAWYAGTDEGWRFYTHTGGNIGFVFGSSTSNYIGVLSTDGGFCDGLWRLLTVTYDGSGSISGLKLFIDGEQVDVNTYGSGTVTGTTESTEDLVVGAASTRNGDGYFHRSATTWS